MPRGGLGNRICSLLSALFYIKIGLYKSMTVNWLLSDHCPIDIEEFCDIKQHVDCDIYRDAPLFPPHPQFKLCKMHRHDTMAASQFWCHENYPRSDKQDMLQCIKMIDFKLPDPMIKADFGLHCRRTDWGHHLYDVNDGSVIGLHNTLDEKFADYLHNIISGDIYIASDSNNTVSYMVKRFDNIKYQLKPDYPLDSKRSANMLREALVDISNLANSRTIIRDSNSSFALIAHLIGGNKMITWSRPILERSGSGYFMNPHSNYQINK
jgi:hypothetical protein